jgi:hypothetical protein
MIFSPELGPEAPPRLMFLKMQEEAEEAADHRPRDLVTFGLELYH